MPGNIQTTVRLYLGATTIWTLLLFSGMGAPVAAQTVEALNRAQIGRDQTMVTGGPTVTATAGPENQVVASPNDPDLGEQQILRRTESYQPFVASVSVPFYWTSNVALTNSGEQSDFLVSPVAVLAYQPRLTKNLNAYASVREQLFYYDRLPSFNFGSFDAEIGLSYTIPQLRNLVVHLGYDYNRLTQKDSFDAFFQNHTLVFSAEMPFRINRAQQLTIGVDTNVSLGAAPEPPRRHDFEAYLGYSVQVTRALALSATGRLTVHDYTDTDRTDVTEMIALNASYTLGKYLTINGLGSFAASQSNQSVFNYRVGNIGGAVAFSIRF
jgi:hypothetical protein